MKKAIIIGGTSGIGQGITDVLVSNKFKVGITGIEKATIEELENSKKENFKAEYLDCINSNTSETITELVNWLGGLDILIFSAGIGNLNKDLGYKVENNANKLNVLAFTEVADWSYRFFKKQGHGHFVSVSSISGLFGSRVAPAYHAAKAYQVSYLEALSQKATKDRKSGLPIYTTDVRPGFVITPLTEGKRLFWAATKEEAGIQIYNLIKKKKNIGYVSRRWRLVAILI
ncbi:SDR family NAD(P)-dependent oxidoreductase [Formosa sp. L2A11]|uniref:SDR family NAD(P)-dependent oxidoreductase n=1 Tax=Formosa sp. L2A11 TaxID=2686363 RepID=UPI00131E433A|nr:SDR family NAD(P)-dependent oxidoreductase [Formosa sp. L2A11]